MRNLKIDMKIFEKNVNWPTWNLNQYFVKKAKKNQFSVFLSNLPI
jgi:hypothetical protein